MSEHQILKYFCPILDKKNPPEDKKLPDPSGLLLKVIPSLLIASCNAKLFKVLKQVKWSVTKNCYIKLALAIVGFYTSLQRWKPCTAVVKGNEYIS